MAHEHEWEDFNVTTSLSLQYSKVQLCKTCRTFLCYNADGTTEERT
jgi:hypothetical protein